jgi:hypothetical protein
VHCSASILTLTTACHHFVEFGFQMQLRMPGFDAFQFDGHLITGGDVCAWGQG